MLALGEFDSYNFLVSESHVFNPNLLSDTRLSFVRVGPSRLLIYNTGSQFETDWARETYRIEHAEDRLRVEQGKLSQEELTSWLK